jgi:membrane associated rhomboid family serine protease
VHTSGAVQISFNFPALLLVGLAAEQLLGSRSWLVIYFLSGLVGEIAGYLWRPYGGGCSVAIAGLAGSLMVWMIAPGRPAPARLGGYLSLAAGIFLAVRHDLHGPPMLAGALLGAIVLRHHFQRPVATQGHPS